MGLAEPFGRITYTEAIELLIKESPKANFQVPVEWGIDLGSEHERYLCEKVYMKPTVVYNYPKDIKAFYMRLNDDEKPLRPWMCSHLPSARSSAAPSARSGWMCSTGALARWALKSRTTGGTATSAASAPCPTPASASGSSASSC